MKHANGTAVSTCESCGQETRPDEVQVTMWIGSELNLIENVPAHICDACDVQYFDPETDAAITALVASGFPAWKAVRHIAVPVFTLGESEEKPAPQPVYEPTPETTY